MDVLVLESPLSSNYDIRCLSSVETDGYTTMLLLTLVTTTRCLAFARGWTTTSSDALVVCAGVVGQVGEDRGGAGLALLCALEEGPEVPRGRGMGQSPD